VPYRGVPKLIALVTLMTMNALGASAVLAQDSFRAVCSGFVENTNNPSKKKWEFRLIFLTRDLEVDRENIRCLQFTSSSYGKA